VSAPVDQGLNAVARVRDMRERDSRYGLRIALEEQRAREAKARRHLEQLEQASSWESGSAQEFQAGRAALSLLSAALTSAQHSAASGRIVTEAARDHWRSDKTRLNAVEMLLERRAALREAEAEHARAKELDDIGTRLWLRHRRSQGGEVR
jgi:flagellar export protein FliJ